MFGDNWSPTASMRTLKYFLADATKNKARVHQLYLIGAFLQAKVKNIYRLKKHKYDQMVLPSYT